MEYYVDQGIFHNRTLVHLTQNYQNHIRRPIFGGTSRLEGKKRKNQKIRKTSKKRENNQEKRGKIKKEKQSTKKEKKFKTKKEKINKRQIKNEEKIL